MSLGLAVIALGVVFTARKWPLTTALFPIVIGTFVFFITVTELLLTFFEKEDTEKESTLDVEFSENIDKSLAVRRTLLAFGWIFGFFLLILLFGFIYAVPLFCFFCTKIFGGEKWGISIVMAISTWGFFYGLFVWLLHTMFQDGLIIMWLEPLWLG
jgi:hypothetical protein